MVPNIMRSLRQLFDHHRIGWVRRVPHPQVDNILPRSPLLIQQPIDPTKKVRWKPVNARSKLNSEGYFSHFESKRRIKVHRADSHTIEKPVAEIATGFYLIGYASERRNGRYDHRPIPSDALYPQSLCSLFQKPFEHSGSNRILEFRNGFGFDLPHALPGNLEDPPDFFQCVVISVG